MKNMILESSNHELQILLKFEFEVIVGGEIFDIYDTFDRLNLKG